MRGDRIGGGWGKGREREDDLCFGLLLGLGPVVVTCSSAELNGRCYDARSRSTDCHTCDTTHITNASCDILTRA